MTRHYDRAPIVEAIIDLRVALPVDSTVEIFDTLAIGLNDSFPTRKVIQALSMGFHQSADGKGDGTFESSSTKAGLRLETADGKRVLQLQLGGFTYSHLPPYSDWSTFRGEARPLWFKYLAATKASQVIRAAVRVINKIPISGVLADLPRYSNLCLKLPEDLNARPDAFFTQFQMDGARWAEGCRVLVNSGAAPRPDGKLEFLLDFDIFVDDPRDAASEETWALLDKLSEAKDALFEACITDSVRELIK
jgi:uncharacterized protein (TIGR04255 family)